MKKENIKNFLFINIFNLIFLIGLYCSNNIFIINFIIVSVYLITIFTRKESTIIEYQFSFMILCSTLLDITYSIQPEITPMWAKYVTDMISIILLMKVLIDRNINKKILKDKLFILLAIVSFIGIGYSILNQNSFSSIFDTYRRIFRFVPVYFVFAYKDVDSDSLINKFKLYFILNILVFVFQCAIGVGKDFRNGMFSKISTSAFYYFIVIFTTYHLNLYIEKKEKILTTLIIIVSSLVCIVLQDGKAYMIFYIFYCVAVIILFNKNLLKKLAIVALMIICIPIGMEVMKKVSPNATFFYNSDNLIKTGLEYMKINNSTTLYRLNRFDAVDVVFEKENDNSINKLFGNGIGSSFQPENEYYSKLYTYDENQKTRIYNEYGDLGYQLSSKNLILLDFGYIGILILILLICYYSIISFRISKSENLTSKIVGMTIMCMVISFIYNLYYGNQFFTREPSYIMFTLIGLAQNLYSKERNNK